MKSDVSSEHDQVDTVAVVDRILAAFVSAIDQDSEVSAIGSKLRKTLLEDKETSEAAIAKAMFGDLVS